MQAIVNIGLAVGTDGRISAAQARAALELAGGDIQLVQVAQSTTEPTLIAVLAAPLSPEAAERLSSNLQQEAIAQLVGETGELYGPGADAWRPFNPDFFMMPDGHRLNGAAIAA